MKKILFIVIALLSSIVFKVPVYSMISGIIAAFFIKDDNFRKFISKVGKFSLQFAVVLTGFGLDIGNVIEVGKNSIGITFFTISITLILGFFLGRLFKTDKELTTLISSGTAICGGSAIAAVSPAINASSFNTGLALAIVFLLNSIGLIIFPIIGHFFELSQESFGLWAAIAIHDTSSVIGACQTYGAKALEIGTTVKLTRALWIFPVTFLMSYFYKKDAKGKFQWFLVYFLLASLISCYFSGFSELWSVFYFSGKKLMIATLFFIGSGISFSEIKKIGIKPLVHSVLLWIFICVISFYVISFGFISI
ncbi:MAG: putative sulfate exporter family transporter [Candidatus Muirbacterium halophilum]|nr:putative sulfate exporter family transporter [Candidatus Muirbacterium halophilum]MCK9477573.1 putative sulfate exporter family transporter [Candidatus Muirbacterium halophilum]